MNLGLATNGAEVKFGFEKVGMNTAKMLVLALNEFAGGVPNPSVITIEMFRAIDRRFHSVNFSTTETVPKRLRIGLGFVTAFQIVFGRLFPSVLFNRSAMKLLSLLFLGMIPALALEIPRHVYTLDKLEEAKAEALEKSEPVIFVYTDPSST